MNKTTHNNRGRKLLEKDIESFGGKECAKRGWLHEKFTSPQKRSVPDRLITTSNGFMFFIEYKRPGQYATPNQIADHTERRNRGVTVFVCDCYEQTEEALAIGWELSMGMEVEIPSHLYL